MTRPTLAVIGAGISGLSAAWLLRDRFAVTLFEAEPRAGGHADTQRITIDNREIAVDTGFIVCNDATYPNLLGLFAHLGIKLHATDMSFGVSVASGAFEYAGGTLPQLFAQPSNIIRPRFWSMVRDILRFYREAPALLTTGTDASLGDYLAANRYGTPFIEDHILPMGAAIWSASVEGMRAFPARHFVRFFVNHGLLQVTNRPLWRTVIGGSKTYVDRLLADLTDVVLGMPVISVRPAEQGHAVRTRAGTGHFDHVIMACHADQALSLLGPAAPPQTAALLADIGFQDNLAILHTDTSLMPVRRAAWSAWNYLSNGQHDHAQSISVTYWMNRLQPLGTDTPILVSLNPIRPPDPKKILLERPYRHPQFNAAAMRAQARLPDIQGNANLWFAGAWTRWGFHEDGIASAVDIAARLGVTPPWAAAP